MLTYFKKLLPGTAAPASQPTSALPRMNLEQRKAYRHEMLYQSVREKLLQLGALPSMYRFQIHALDERCHRFHVAIEVSGAFQIQLQDQTLDFAQIAALLRRHSHAAYGLVIETMDWQVHAGSASFTRERRAQDTPGTVIKPHTRCTSSCTPCTHAGTIRQCLRRMAAASARPCSSERRHRRYGWVRRPMRPTSSPSTPRPCRTLRTNRRAEHGAAGPGC